MYSKVYFPRFFHTQYEQEIERKLQSYPVLIQSERKTLLKLKNQVSILANSLHELKEIHDSYALRNLESLISQTIDELLNNRSLSAHSISTIDEHLLQLKQQLKMNAPSSDNVISYFNLTADIIFSLSSAAGILLFGAALFTGPLGFMFLGTLLMTSISIFTFGITTYSAYVETRFILDKQLDDVTRGINFLKQFPDLNDNDEETGATAETTLT